MNDSPIPYEEYLAVAVLKFGISINDFWKMSFGEFFAIYDCLFGKVVQPLSRDEYEDLKRKWKH